MNHFTGFMYGLEFSAAVTPLSPACNNLDCPWCRHASDECMSICDWDQYIDAMSMCHSCHATCKHGCLDDLPCDEV